MGAMLELCIDTSVWVKLWLPEDDSPLAYALLDRLADQPFRLVGPPILPLEVASVLRTGVRRNLLTDAQASAAWASFRIYPIDIDADPGLPDRAYTLARRLNLPTAYDAAFLATCSGRPLVITADRALYTACQPWPELQVIALHGALSALGIA